MTTAILVIDMLRGFFEEAYPLYCGYQARQIIPRLRDLLQKESEKGSRIYFLCDHHAPDDPEFEAFPPHCIAGTDQAELIPELAGIPGEIIPKARYSGFFESALESKLQKAGIEKLVVCGVCTDICVMYTVAEARNRGYSVEVPVDCVASFNTEGHRFALGHMEKVLGATLTQLATPYIPTAKSEIPEQVLSGKTADIYFVRARQILQNEGLNPIATMEVFSRSDGILCGINEAFELLSNILPEDHRDVWALGEGDSFSPKEVVLRITAPYQTYAMYETAYLGMLSSTSGWASAAQECVLAAAGTPVLSFGARHVHPSVAGMMEYAAIIGGCAGCATSVGAALTGTDPIGTLPHALILVMGDTAKATLAFNQHMPSEVARVALVDTFRDEPEESVIVAREMAGKLHAVRLDTPFERGGVTVDLVKETRGRLDLAGFPDVKIYVSGGMNPERIRHFIENNAPVDTFAVGSYISGARPIDFTADLHEIEGKPIAKRGRVPGITPNPRLKRIL